VPVNGHDHVLQETQAMKCVETIRLQVAPDVVEKTVSALRSLIDDYSEPSIMGAMLLKHAVLDTEICVIIQFESPDLLGARSILGHRIRHAMKEAGFIYCDTWHELRSRCILRGQE